MAKFAVADALKALAGSGGAYQVLLGKPAFDIGLYKPGASDDQTPHKRDELYVIAAGTGTFVCGEQRDDFSPGDAFFVEAGTEHRFENYSSDFSVWVIFFEARS